MTWTYLILSGRTRTLSCEEVLQKDKQKLI
jgi:hypothetical protein